MTEENNTLDLAYRASLKGLMTQIAKAELSAADQETVTLAHDLVEGGIAFDRQRLSGLLETAFDGHLRRDFDNPPEYTSSTILNQPWSDHADHPLLRLEKWNDGRRATNTGIRYSLDEQGFPVNPYANYGIKGRGVTGMYGPNHAVDMGILRVMPNATGKPALHVLGIIRHDSGKPALCGGYTVFTRYGDGIFSYDEQTKINSQAHEFFEEMISGSVELMDKYKEGLEKRIECAIAFRENIQGTLTDKDRQRIRAQLTTERKVEQIHHEDPLFLSGLRHAFLTATSCYEGPVLSSSRNTNTAWMETRLSYFMMDEGDWTALKGADKFHYDLMAGDDAAAVRWHEITPELIGSADSHGALFTFLLSGFLATHAPKDPDTLAAIKDQAKELLDFFQEPALAPAGNALKAPVPALC